MSKILKQITNWTTLYAKHQIKQQNKIEIFKPICNKKSENRIKIKKPKK